jgi:hypothetical protein
MRISCMNIEVPQYVVVLLVYSLTEKRRRGALRMRAGPRRFSAWRADLYVAIEGSEQNLPLRSWGVCLGGLLPTSLDDAMDGIIGLACQVSSLHAVS